MASADARPYTVVLIDVAGSAGHTNPWQLRMRADLRRIIAEVCREQRYAATAVELTDTGDGMRLILTPEISVIDVLGRFVPAVAAAVHAYRIQTPEGRFALRVAADTGLLHRDHGWHGTPLILCARLCDASPVRQVLRANADADLVLVVSARVYEEVVRHGYDGIDPATYHRVAVREKETETVAWVHVPGVSRPAGLETSESAAPVPFDDDPYYTQVTMSATTFGAGRVYQAARDQFIDEHRRD